MKIIKLASAIILSLIVSLSTFASGPAQLEDLEIVDPGVFSPTTITATDLLAVHTVLEALRTAEVITKINIATVITDSTVDFDDGLTWPPGTWGLGYYSQMAELRWLTETKGGRYWSGHPLIRDTAEFSLAYLHFHRQFKTQVYKDRLDEGLTYLIQVQCPSGGFMWWGYRPKQDEPDAFSDHCRDDTTNREGLFDTSFALRVLAEGYWYKQTLGETDLDDHYRAIVKVANYLLAQNNYGNANVRGLGIWALVGAYKITGDKQYLNKAIDFAEWLIDQQEKAGDQWDGVWRTGGHDEKTCTPPDQCETVTIDHDTAIWYHMIILRGLVEMLSATPENRLPFKNDLRGSIKRAVNHIINERIYTPTNRLYSFHLDIKGNTIPEPPQSHIYTYGIDGLGMLAYYARTDPGFSEIERTRLIHLFDRLFSPVTDRRKVDAIHIAYYHDYRTVISHTEMLDYWMPRRDELFYKFKEDTPIYRSQTIYDLETAESIYAGSIHLETWLTGDFDGNGDDELLQKFKSSPYIYFSEDGFNLGTVRAYSGTQNLALWLQGDFDCDQDLDGDEQADCAGDEEVLYRFEGTNPVYLAQHGNDFNLTPLVYDGNVQLEAWLAGDFDGDGDDEVLQDFANNDFIYISESGRDLGGSERVYSEAAQLEHWLAGDFDGDGDDELLYKFADSPHIYSSQDGCNLALGEQIYSGSAHLETWLAGDFNGDGDEELLYKFQNNVPIYLSEDGYDLAAGDQVYVGSAQLETWIAGDFDGDRDDEVLQKFKHLSYIYISEDGYNLGTVRAYSGTQQLDQWIVGNFGSQANLSAKNNANPMQTFVNPTSDYLNDDRNRNRVIQTANINNESRCEQPIYLPLISR